MLSINRAVFSLTSKSISFSKSIMLGLYFGISDSAKLGSLVSLSSDDRGRSKFLSIREIALVYYCSIISLCFSVISSCFEIIDNAFSTLDFKLSCESSSKLLFFRSGAGQSKSKSSSSSFSRDFYFSYIRFCLLCSALFSDRII